MNDQEMMNFLLDLDKSDVTCTTWEASFIDSALKRQQVKFTPKQRDVVIKMMDKYEMRI